MIFTFEVGSKEDNGCPFYIEGGFGHIFLENALDAGKDPFQKTEQQEHSGLVQAPQGIP